MFLGDNEFDELNELFLTKRIFLGNNEFNELNEWRMRIFRAQPFV